MKFYQLYLIIFINTSNVRIKNREVLANIDNNFIDINDNIQNKFFKKTNANKVMVQCIARQYMSLVYMVVDLKVYTWKLSTVLRLLTGVYHYHAQWLVPKITRLQHKMRLEFLMSMKNASNIGNNHHTHIYIHISWDIYIY